MNIHDYFTNRYCEECDCDPVQCYNQGYCQYDKDNGNAELQKQVNELKGVIKDLDWYKMWHNKHKKEIEDLTLELETYRPTKLKGHGQCECSNCGVVNWTDWFSQYKGKTLCDKCLKEILTKEEQQAIKDTAKEIEKELEDKGYFEYGQFTINGNDFIEIFKKRGVEAE